MMARWRFPCSAVALLAGLSLLGCAERQADIPAAIDEEIVACIGLGTYGHYADGTHEYMFNEHGKTPTVCMCMTPEELGMRAYDELLHELGYEECVRVAQTYYDFDWDDCESSRDDESWAVVAAVDDAAGLNQTGLVCGDDTEGDALACTSASPQSREPWAPVLLVGALVWRRRKQTRLRGQPGTTAGDFASRPDEAA